MQGDIQYWDLVYNMWSGDDIWNLKNNVYHS